MNTSQNLCSALRNCYLTHADVETVMACLASSLQFSDLSEHCLKIVQDMLDEITGQVEDDRVQQEQMSNREDVPGFEGTHASLDALTIRVVS